MGGKQWTLVLVGLVLGCAWIGMALQDVSCQDPQKKVYLSFESLSKRDTMANVFQEANRQALNYDFVYNKSETETFNISQMHPQIYYNEHHQVETFINDYTANVTLGSMEFAFRFNYQIIVSGKVIKEGWAHGRQVMDESYFTKKLTSQNGSIEWDPVDTPNLTISSQLPIDYSEPKLEHSELEEFELMLNDKVGNRTLKQTILSSFSIHYHTILKQHLNAEHMFGTTTINYYWMGIYYYFTHAQKVVKLYNNGTMKGLQGGFFFEVKDYPQNCSKLPQMEDPKKYGGLQEMISMGTINATFWYAMQHNAFNTYFYSTWEVPQFQFRMGDLSNICAQAANEPAANYIYPMCVRDSSSENKPVISKFKQDSLRVQIPYKCTIKNPSQLPLIQITMMAQFVVKIIPDNDFLVFSIDQTAVYDAKFEAVDADKKWVVTNTELANQYMRLILAKAKNTHVMGTNWRTQYRRFPTAFVTDDYLLIYDPSEL